MTMRRTFREILLIIQFVLLCLLSNCSTTTAQTDHNSQQCAPCSCIWSSGKKLADCQNKMYDKVPTHLTSEMQVLDLSHNRIAEFRREEFRDAHLENLHKIFARNCSIEVLHESSLSGLAILIELDLSQNFIKILKPRLFENLSKLRVLILNNNQIEDLPDGLFNNLSALTKIELKNNRLRRIGFYTFSRVPKLKEIYLESNMLSVLSRETFDELELSSLSLINNPWNCTCDLRQFRDFIVDEKKLYTPPTLCAAPEQLKGRPLNEIAKDELACRPNIIYPRSGISMDATTDNVTLTCQIKAWPAPSVTWTHNNRPMSFNDPRFDEKLEKLRDISSNIFKAELMIFKVKNSDKGSYTCHAQNKGGKAETEIVLALAGGAVPSTPHTYVPEKTNIIIIACIISGVFLFILILITIALCCYCRRTRKYIKNGSMSENGLVASKIDKSQNDSMFEGGSVIKEMQKALLTDANMSNVNPVEKPPRRASESNNSKSDICDAVELKRTLLDDTSFGCHDDETQSIALSDTTSRSRHAYIDDGYNTQFPPDLLAFSGRFAQSPSLHSSVSNIQDGRLYVKSPISSPSYSNNPVVYGRQVIAPQNFRTLQHPKNVRPIALGRANSPFTPGPIIYPPVLLKQGYVTIPRKPRIPSWTPSMYSTMSDFPPTSPTSVISGEIVEPVYDNLGLRTTIGGNSSRNINKIGQNPNAIVGSPPFNYSMKDRPLPATPISIVGMEPNSEPIKLYEPIPETASLATGGADFEPLYGKSNTKPVINATGEMATKIPPRPPPKPKKRQSIAGGNESGVSLVEVGATSLDQNGMASFEDEGEDGTEV